MIIFWLWLAGAPWEAGTGALFSMAMISWLGTGKWTPRGSRRENCIRKSREPAGLGSGLLLESCGGVWVGLGPEDEGTPNNFFFLRFDLELGRLREWEEYRIVEIRCKAPNWTTKLIYRTIALIAPPLLPPFSGDFALNSASAPAASDIPGLSQTRCAGRSKRRRWQEAAIPMAGDPFAVVKIKLRGPEGQFKNYQP